MKGTKQMFKEMLLKNSKKYFTSCTERKTFYRCIPKETFWELYHGNEQGIKNEGVTIRKRQSKADRKLMFYAIIGK